MTEDENRAKKRAVKLSDITSRKKPEDCGYGGSLEPDGGPDENIKAPGLYDGSDGGDADGRLSLCLAAAMRILAFADNSERQLREKLGAKGYTPFEIGCTLDTLRKKRFVDDRRYIENKIRYLAKTKLYGRGRIRLELAEKVDREALDRHFPILIEELEEEIDFPEKAARLADKYRGKSREYIYAKLKNNGFTSSEVGFALEQING